MIDPDQPSDLYVSCVEGCPVARFGSSPTQIGATRSEAGFVYQPELVVMIPASEARRFFREYNRALRNNELRVRSAEEWKAQCDAEAAAVRANEEAKAQAAAQPKADPATAEVPGNQE